MTFNGWLQIALYCVVIVLLVKPFGGYMTRVFTGERTFLSPVLSPVERVFYELGGVDEKQRPELGDLCRVDAAVQPGRLRQPLCADALPGDAAVQPGRPVGGRGGPRLQHGDELRHQHQLAVLRARDDDELPRPDGGAHRAQLRLGRDRHRARGRPDPRLRPALGQGHRQLLGRSHALHALRPAADLASSSACSSSGRACRRTSAPTPRRPRSKAPSR